MSEKEENQDAGSNEQTVAAAVFVLAIALGCIGLIFAAMYRALGTTGLAIVALIIG